MKNLKEIPIYSEQESFFNQQFTDFFIADYQDKEDELPNRVKAHRHTYYEIIWVRQGKGIHTIDFDEFSFDGPCLFLLHPQNIHTITKERRSEGGVIKFGTTFFYGDNDKADFMLKYGVFDDIDRLPVIRLTHEEACDVALLFNQIRREYESKDAFAPAILVAYLKIFLLKIFQIKKKSVNKICFQHPDFIRYQRFLTLLDSNYKTQQKVSFYADTLSISPRTLSNLTNRFTGKSTQALIQDRLILEAKRLLYHSDYSIKEIAYLLNFQDVSYFNRFFLKNASATPLNFRNKGR